MTGQLFDPAVLLSLAIAMYAGAFWLWFAARNPARAILVLGVSCAFVHLTLQRYHGLLNSPSLHLMLALFWLTPLGLSALRPGPLARPAVLVYNSVIFAYVAICAAVFFAAITSDLLFVLLLQPGLLLCILYMLEPRRDPALIFSALACFWAVLWFLAYAPLASAVSGESENYLDPADMWPLQRGYLAIFWAGAALPILRDVPDRSRMMVWGAVIAFGALVQYRMSALLPFLAFAAVSGALFVGGAIVRLRAARSAG